MEETDVKVKDERPEKLSYEQLENVAHQLSEQSKKLYEELQKANMTNIFKRLDYLFKVLEFNPLFDSEFVTKCITEVMDLMTIPESDKEGTETPDNE